MRTISLSFITSSQFAAAYNQVRKVPGELRLEMNRTGKADGWQRVATGVTAAQRFVKGLDGSPVPGRFRLVKVSDASAGRSKQWRDQAAAIARVATALAEGTLIGPTYPAILKLQSQVETLLDWTEDDRS